MNNRIFYAMRQPSELQKAKFDWVDLHKDQIEVYEIVENPPISSPLVTPSIPEDIKNNEISDTVPFLIENHHYSFKNRTSNGEILKRINDGQR